MEIHLKEFKMTFNGSKNPRTRTRARASKQGGMRRDSKFKALRAGFVSLLLVVFALVLLGGVMWWSGERGAPVEVRLRIDRRNSVVVSGTLTQEYDEPVLRE